MTVGRVPAAIAGMITILLAAAPAYSQQPSASVMWGTVSTGVGGGGIESAASHLANGNAAGQVEAARRGWLLGTNISITSIGVQNNISVIGDNNDISASQNGINSGPISNGGRVTSIK